MGDPNSNSSITRKLNAIARRRIRDGSESRWVVDLRDKLKNAIEPLGNPNPSLDDRAKLATEVALTAWSSIAALGTENELLHWEQDVPDEVKIASIAFIYEAVREDRIVEYSVQRDASVGPQIGVDTAIVAVDPIDVPSQLLQRDIRATKLTTNADALAGVGVNSLIKITNSTGGLRDGTFSVLDHPENSDQTVVVKADLAPVNGGQAGTISAFPAAPWEVKMSSSIVAGDHVVGITWVVPGTPVVDVP